MNHSVKYRYKPNTLWMSLFSILILLGWQQGNAQCYAKCVIPARYNEVKVALPIFTGDKSKVNPRYIEVLDKKNYPIGAPLASENTKNSTRTKSLTELIIVKDTNEVKTFELHTYEFTELIEKERIEKRHQVLCKEDLTPTLIQLIKTSLQRAHYYQGAIDSKMDAPFHKSIDQFQLEHGLVKGIIDFETLDALNISYKGAF